MTGYTVTGMVRQGGNEKEHYKFACKKVIAADVANAFYVARYLFYEEGFEIQSLSIGFAGDTFELEHK